MPASDKEQRLAAHKVRMATQTALAAVRAKKRVAQQAYTAQPTRQDKKSQRKQGRGSFEAHGGGAAGAGPKKAQGYGKAYGPLGEPHKTEEHVNLPRTLQALALVEARSSTTFGKCKPGAMVSTSHMRSRLPLNQFANPKDTNPTWPIRSKCRASLAGLGRALQFTNASKPLKKQVLNRVNKLGGVRGKARIKLWGTGVGGSRMETHRGPPGKAKRHPSYGSPTGERDSRLHTDKSEHGKAGNREVSRVAGHAAKGPTRTQSKGKQKRETASRKVTIKRGQRRIGRGGATPSITRAPSKEGEGRDLAARFAAQAKGKNVSRKGKKGRK